MIERPRSACGRAGCVLLLCAIALGSALAGDFGRPDPSIFEGIIPKQLYVGPVAPLSMPAPNIPHSLYPLTDDELLLRDQSFALLSPPQTRDAWNVLVASFAEAQFFPLDILRLDRLAYGNMLVGMPYASEVGRYSRLIDDVTSDYMLVGPFMTTACRVLDMNARRARSLAYVQGFTEYEIANALARNNEDRVLIEGVGLYLNDRALSYRYALERLVVAVPSRLSVQAEQAIGRFAAQVAGFAIYVAQCVPPVAVVEHGVPPPPLITK